MSFELITIQELLRDKQYREYFLKTPRLPDHYTPEMKPWKLIVMKKGESVWRTERYETYKDAFLGLKTMLPSISNAAINCPALTFNPPMKLVKIKGKVDRYNRPVLKTITWHASIPADLEPHYWCPYCRRPTIFKFATKNLNRAGSTYQLGRSEPAIRCVICGASDRIVDLRQADNHQKWDASRLKPR